MAAVSEMYYFVFYLTCAVVNVAGTYYDRVYMNDIPALRLYGGRIRYLTCWVQYSNLMFSLASVLVSLSVVVTKRKARWLAQCISIRDGYFYVSLPFNFVAVIMFWVMTYIDIDSVVPADTRLMVPLAGGFNCYLHVFPVVQMALASKLLDHAVPTNANALKAMMVVFVAYSIMQEWVQHKTGVGLYPFFTRMRYRSLRILFYVFNSCLAMIMFASFTRWRKAKTPADAKAD